MHFVVQFEPLMSFLTHDQKSAAKVTRTPNRCSLVAGWARTADQVLVFVAPVLNCARDVFQAIIGGRHELCIVAIPERSDELSGECLDV